MLAVRLYCAAQAAARRLYDGAAAVVFITVLDLLNNREWWSASAAEFNGIFDSGVWTVYLTEPPAGLGLDCTYYDNEVRLLFYF